MARWRLTEPHYLNGYTYDTERTEWEQVEIAQDAKKQMRKRYTVPLFLDPKDPSAFNYPGEIVVSDKPNGRDIVFHGPPTPGMDPMDEEARQLSEAESKNWIHPIESLPGQGFAENLLAQLTSQLSALQNQQPVQPVQAVAESQVSAKDFNELKGLVAQLMEQNAALQAQLAEPRPERRA